MAPFHRPHDQPACPCGGEERARPVLTGPPRRRKSGTVYETPIIVAPVPEGFVAELTYGRRVAWSQNSLAAGGCELLVHGETHAIGSITPLDAAAGQRAFGAPRSWVLRLLRRHEFLTMHVAR